MGKDAFYFSHDSNARNDPKILHMRADYGAEGYGWYWMIIEMLRDESDYKMRLQYVRNAVAMQLQCDADAAENFVKKCIEQYKLFDSDKEFFWSNSLIRRMEKRAEKSEKARLAAISRWDKSSNANAMQTQCERNAIKERKGKEIKENIYTSEFETFWNIYPRKEEKKASFTAWKARIKEGYTSEQIIHAANNYLAKCKADKTELRFIKMPKTFLGPNGHINDYLRPRAPNEGPYSEQEKPFNLAEYNEHVKKITEKMRGVP